MTQTRTKSTRLPRWLIILLIAQAALLWSLWISLLWFARSHWVTFLSIPIDLARLIILAGAIAVSGFTGLMAWRSSSSLALKLYSRWQSIVSTPVGWFLVAILASVAAWLGIDQPSIWIGHRLLSLFFLAWLLIVLLSHPRQYSEAFQRRVWLVVPVIVLVIGSGIRVWWILADQVWTDEGFHLSAAAGMLAGKSIAPANMFFPPDIIIPPWRGFAFAIYKLWSGIVGLGLLQMRILAYAFGLLALSFIYGALKLWHNQRTALVGVSLVSLTWLLMMSSLGRNDSLPMLATSIILFVHLYAWKHNRPALHGLVGVLVGLSLETHFAVAPIVATWTAYYAMDYGCRAFAAHRIFQKAPLWSYLAGLMPVLVAYVIVHIVLLPDPAGFFRTAGAFSPSDSIGLGQFSSYFVSRIRLYWVEAPLELLLITLSVATALMSRSESNRHWLGLFGLTLLGYMFLGTDPQISHTIYALPIWLAGLGPMVSEGWGSKRLTSGSLPLGIYLVVASLLINSTLQELVIDHENRVHFDAKYTAEAAIIREFIQPEDAIIAPPIYIPYLIDDTQDFLHNYFPGVRRAPLLVDEDINHYWQSILLETWPTVRIEASGYINPELPVQIDYTNALHAKEIAQDIWYVDVTEWTVDLTEPPAEVTTPLLLIAHQAPMLADNTLTIQTAWANRKALQEDISVTVFLRDVDDRIVATATAPLFSGWDAAPTSAWDRPGFHDVAFTLALPTDLPVGTYSLFLRVEADPVLCLPWCEMQIEPVSIP